MEKVFIGLLLILLIFPNCRRKDSNSLTVSETNQNDTAELPPMPPGDTGYNTSSSNNYMTTNQTAPVFIFLPHKKNLESGNIGIEYRESKPNIFYINICGGINVFGITFDFDYDTDKLILKKAEEGDFLNKDGKKTSFIFSNQIVAVSRLTQASGGVTGDGCICTIEFEAKKTFDSLLIGFRNQKATDKAFLEVLPAGNWFGGILEYK
ncbi:MAG: cohesin domain-containing protein [bacterium]